MPPKKHGRHFFKIRLGEVVKNVGFVFAFWVEILSLSYPLTRPTTMVGFCKTAFVLNFRLISHHSSSPAGATRLKVIFKPRYYRLALRESCQLLLTERAFRQKVYIVKAAPLSECGVLIFVLKGYFKITP